MRALNTEAHWNTEAQLINILLKLLTYYLLWQLNTNIQELYRQSHSLYEQHLILWDLKIVALLSNKNMNLS